MMVNPYRHAPPIGLGVATGSYLHNLGADTTTRAAVLDAIVSSGARWVREEFSWPNIQPTNSSTFDWTVSDAIVSECNARGLRIIALQGGSPAWARPTTYAAGNGSSPPDSPTTFGTFAGIFATRYAASIRHHEIWNEPNSKIFWGGVSAPFDPSASVYYGVLAAAYDAIHAADPGATVLTAGLAMTATSGGNIDPLEFFDAFLDVGATKQDGIGTHPYGYPLKPSSTFYDHGWRQQHLSTPSYLSIMGDHGIGHLKFWATEYGAPTNGPPIPMSVVGTTPSLTETAAGATSIAATKPTLNAATEVLMVAHFTANAAPTSTPSGWTLIPSATVTNGTWHSSGYYKAVTGSNVASEPSTYTWGFASSAATVIIRPYYGTNLASPFDVTATTASNNNATTVAIGQVTTTVNGVMLVTGAGQNSTTGTLTVPAGTTSVSVSAGTGKSARMAEETRATAGATGTRTWTFNSAALAHGGWMAALRPGTVTAGTRANNYGLDTYAVVGLPLYNDEQTQADLMDDAIRLARQQPGLFAHLALYTLLDYEPPATMTDRENHFGFLESDGTPKDASAVITATITDTGGPT